MVSGPMGVTVLRLSVYADRLVFLAAPYLVTFEQWKKYLSTFGGGRQLEGFGLMQSAREF